MRQTIENIIDLRLLRAFTAWTLLVSCILCAIIYSYFISQSIFRTYESRQLSQESSVILSNLNVLEAEYLSLQEETTLENAHSFGLSEAGERYFISRRSLGALSRGDGI